MVDVSSGKLLLFHNLRACIFFMRRYFQKGLLKSSRYNLSRRNAARGSDTSIHLTYTWHKHVEAF